MIIQGDYGNPIHGVSKQPDSRMFRGQSRELINCRCDPTKGLSRRSPWEYVARLQTTSVEPIEQVRWRVHERGDGSAILYAFAQDTPRLWDLEGNSLPFQFQNPAAKSYYTFGNKEIQSRFGISSVLDTTFITNREKVPAGFQNLDKDAKPPHFLWLEFKTFNPGATWVVELDGKQYGSMLYKHEDVGELQGLPIRPIWDGWYKPDEADAIKRQNESYQGAYNAETFELHYDSDPALGYTILRYNNWIGIKRNNPTNESQIPLRVVEGDDSIVLHDSRDIKAIEKLPPVGQESLLAVVKEGTGAELSKGYFKASLSTVETTDSFGPVSWGETVAYGSRGHFTASTMPHIIQWDEDLSSWVMKPQEWRDREVGDKDSNPYPSFILNKTPIQSIGLFQNRVFYGAGESLMFSASDVYNDLWVESAYYHTDADPFELTVDSDKVNNIQYAGTFDKDLIFFSQNGQFIMPGDQTHTYEKAYVQTATNYQADLTADPVLAGDNILFAYSNGSYTGIREYYTDNLSGSQRSTPTTNHVDTYMLGDVRHLAGSTSIDALFVMLKNNDSDVFVNEWMREGAEKVQNAWHRWNIAEGLRYEWIGFIGALVYSVVREDGADGSSPAYHLLRMRWDTPASLYGLPFTPYMDCMYPTKPVREEDGYTIYRVPFDREDWVFIEDKDSTSPGFEIRLERLNEFEWRWYGSNTLPLIAGLRFKSSWFPAMPRVTDQRDVTQEIQRLQLSQMLFHFAEVGKVSLEVTSRNGRRRVTDFTNRRVDDPNNQVDSINTNPDSWKVPVRQKVDGLSMELSTDDVTPCTIRGAEWTADYRQRGRRV